MSDQWLSIVEYARQFNISDMTVRRRIKNGKLQAILREGKYYIPITGSVQAPQAAVTPRVSHQPVVKPRPDSFEARSHTTSHHTNQEYRPQAKQSYIPSSISQTMQGRDQVTTVDAATLLAFCEGSLQKLNETEARIEAQYQEKVCRLENTIATKELEIKQLSQQIEDLQVLVKILEKK